MEGSLFMTDEFVITKKLAKHGKQCVLVIPNYLQSALKAGSVVEVRIKTLQMVEQK